MKLSVKIASAMGALGLMLSAATGAAAAGLTADAAEIQALLKNEPQNALVIDVRTPAEFAGGYIKGATLIQMRDIPSSLGRIPKSKKIIVVCASGARSGAVVGYLSKEGYPWVKNYAGGMVDWQQKGLPVVKP